MTATYGQAATIENIPTPLAAINIVSSTNASPTVITATAHGLHTGQVVIIDGHAVNTNANGIWICAVVTVDTFRITTFSGTLINGNGVGGATGTVQNLGLPGVTLPQDTTDDMDATSVNVPFESLLDMTAWLAYKIHAAQHILPGGSWTADTGSNWNMAGNGLVTGPIDFNATALNLNAQTAVSQAANARIGEAATVYLTDAGHTVSRATGPMSSLATPSAPHVIIVAEASDTDLQNGHMFEFFLPLPSFATGSYALRRESAAPGTYICTITGELGGVDKTGYARLKCAGGVWRGDIAWGVTMGPDW